MSYFISHLSLSVLCYFHCPWVISIKQINCHLCLLTSLISFSYSLISFHHRYMINHPTILSFNFFSIYYQGLQLPISYIVYCSKSLSLSLSSSSFFLICVWVEVMFEIDNTRKLKAEGGNMAQRCIAVLHPLCVLCYYFLKYQPNTHQAYNTHRNASSIFARFILKTWSW